MRGRSSEVARAVGLSERSLFDRFRRSLDRSVHEEITRVRVERICWMLEHTAMSLLEIALAMGLPDDKHLSRYFQRCKQVTPAAWRRRQFGNS